MVETKDGLARVAKIVRDLKDFSRAGDAVSQWADLHQGIDSTLNIVWNELKYKCTVRKEYGELPLVWCVPSQINQVVMNLLVNAAHAIPEKGEITIRTGQQAEQVFIAISDTGTGIAQENLNRIFEPFFTTKPVGKGTGLGLSLAYSIMQKHRGRIEVASKPGAGTTFTLWLPLEAPQPDAAEGHSDA
jgi:signal transduction histidine kinase